MFRSTTDEMLAARFDPAPWLNRAGEHDSLQPGEKRPNGWVYLPRPEFIPPRDPEPYVNTRTGNRYPDTEAARYFTVAAPGLCRFDPRPEHARPKPNPILVELRKHWQPGFEEEEIQMALESTAGTPAQIEHARKVLTRLANIYKEV